jgi:hypothetical protein
LDPDNLDQIQPDPTPAPPRDVLMTEKEDDWREPFLAFLVDQRAPEDKAECERITQRSANYIVIDNDIYRKATSAGVLMKCILRSEGLHLLANIHGNECGCHRHPAT